MEARVGWLTAVSAAGFVVQVIALGASPFGGPADVLAAVRARGAKAVVADVWATDAWQKQIQPGVVSGDAKWLEVAQALHSGTDAGSAEDLNQALTVALLRAPHLLLPILRDLWWTKADADVCVFAYDSELPGGVPDYVRRLEKALRRRGSLGPLERQCLQGLTRTRRSLPDRANP
jgi:hypothetical protein